MDDEVEALIQTGLDYLKEELKLWTGTPGNHGEVARILKALKSFGQRDTDEGDSGSADALRRQFRADLLED